jgi:hypothetical protein
VDYNLRVNPAKLFESIDYIGRHASGLTFGLMEVTRLQVESWAPPAIKVLLQAYLGLANYCRDFVDNFATLNSPLHSLAAAAAKPTTKLEWTPELIAVFEESKHAIAICADLHHMDPTLPTFVSCDASNAGWGAILWQLLKDETGFDHKKVVRFLSGAFNKVQQRWPTIEQEAFAIFKAVTTWRLDLMGKKFTLFTDHRNLTFVLNSETKKLLRWRLALQEFDFEIVHIAGLANWEADTLSRLHGI